MFASGSSRKAVYDEFDGKGLQQVFLATTLVYYIAVREEGQNFELIVKSFFINSANYHL